MTDEVRNEADKLTAEYRAKETQHRAAIVSEGEEQRAAEGASSGMMDGEPAEVRALLSRVTIGDYLADRPRRGSGWPVRPVELAAASKRSRAWVRPVGSRSRGRSWSCPNTASAPAPRVEHRAFTTTSAA